MKQHAPQNSKTAFVAGLLLIVICTSGWQFPDSEAPVTAQNRQIRFSDTTHPGTVAPDKINLGIKSDSLLMAAQMALSAIDFGKMQEEISASLASINFNEINKNVEAAFKSIEWDKIKVETKKALEEAKAEIASINKEEIKADIEKAKEELKKAQAQQKKDFAAVQKEVQEELAKAKQEIESKKAELANYRSFIATLEKDGLLQPGAPYEVSLKNGVLYINGVRQPDAITEKYRKFYGGKTDFTLYDNKKGSSTHKPTADL